MRKDKNDWLKFKDAWIIKWKVSLSKKDNGIRPVAVGYILRWPAANSHVVKLQQLTVGVSGRTEASRKASLLFISKPWHGQTGFLQCIHHCQKRSHTLQHCSSHTRNIQINVCHILLLTNFDLQRTSDIVRGRSLTQGSLEFCEAEQPMAGRHVGPIGH